MNDDKNKAPISTFKLLEEIVKNSNRDSLRVFVEYKFFKEGSKFLNLSEYLIELQSNKFRPYSDIRNNETDINQKIDLTYDKLFNAFYIIRPKEKIAKRTGYCNTQYEYIYNKILYMERQNKILDFTTREEIVSNLFQRLVRRQIMRRWGEAVRDINNERYGKHRFGWIIKEDERYDLDFPRDMLPSEMEKWLNENQKDWLDQQKRNGRTNQKTLKEEIQIKIYERFSTNMKMSIDNEDYYTMISSEVVDPIDQMNKNYLSDNLFEKIAIYTSEHLELVSPSIRILGKEKVFDLVIRILSEFDGKTFNAAKISEEFNLSTPTFSRFAGMRRLQDENNKIPDLWVISKNVVYSDPIFLESAQEIGFVDLLLTVMK